MAEDSIDHLKILLDSTKIEELKTAYKIAWNTPEFPEGFNEVEFLKQFWNGEVGEDAIFEIPSDESIDWFGDEIGYEVYGLEEAWEKNAVGWDTLDTWEGPLAGTNEDYNKEQAYVLAHNTHLIRFLVSIGFEPDQYHFVAEGKSALDVL